MADSRRNGGEEPAEEVPVRRRSREAIRGEGAAQESQCTFFSSCVLINLEIFTIAVYEVFFSLLFHFLLFFRES